MEYELHRNFKGNEYTIGRLYLAHAKVCDTLEDPVRILIDKNKDGDFDDAGEGKIWGQTAIPAGRYRIIMQMSPSKNRMMPYLQDVPGYTSVMIHSGNTAEDTHGCILVGENKVKGKLINSRAWSDVINAQIRDAIAQGEEVWINISE